MLELMNMAALEANARRRVELIRDEMRASRARGNARLVTPAGADHAARRPRAQGLEAGAGDAPAAPACCIQPLAGA